jgi:predicted MFS family arabinose efflux permease
MAGAAAVASPYNARVQGWIGAAPTTRLALAFLGGAPVLLAFGAVGLGPPALIVGLIVLGAGFGLLNAPLLSRLTHAIEGDRQPVAVGIYNLCFFLGGAVGAAISSAIVQAGIELPGIGSASLPGFATAELFLAVGPLIGAILARGDPG